MKSRNLVLVILSSILLLAGIGYAQRSYHHGEMPAAVAHNTSTTNPAAPCEENLWQHVYIGDRRRFNKPQDRLKIVDPCKTVTGTIISSVPKPDGETHIQLLLDPGQESLLNARNRAKNGGQHGNLVIEPICQQTPTQPDTAKEGVCKGFRQSFPVLVQIKSDLKKHKGTHVEITGAFVSDMEHGWNEIHPVTSIVIK